MHFLWFGAFFIYFFAITIPNAHAYLDPGTGSYVFQVVAGALLGAAVAVKVFWSRLVGVRHSPFDRRTTVGAPGKTPSLKDD